MSTVEPTPFGVERARELLAKRGPSWQWTFDDAGMTPGENAYVLKVWKTLPASWSWMDAFMWIETGNAEKSSK